MKHYKIKLARQDGTSEFRCKVIPQISNLGAVLSMVARIEADRQISYDDVHVYGAPSECYALVSKGYDRDEQEMWDKLKHEEGITETMLINACEDRGVDYQRALDRCTGRILWRDNPFR